MGQRDQQRQGPVGALRLVVGTSSPASRAQPPSAEQLSPASGMPVLVPEHLPSMRAMRLMLLGGVRPRYGEAHVPIWQPWWGVPLPAHTRGWGKQKARVSCDKDGSQFPRQSKVRGSSAALALIGTGPCTDTLQTAKRALQRHPAARQPCRPEG